MWSLVFELGPTVERDGGREFQTESPVWVKVWGENIICMLEKQQEAWFLSGKFLIIPAVVFDKLLYYLYFTLPQAHWSSFSLPDYLTCLLKNLYAGQEATEPNMEQQTGSKLEKEYIKVYIVTLLI